MIIIAEAFCISERDKALLKLFFFHNQPEGIIEIGRINIGQKKCMNALYQEYYSPYDDLQRSILRNLLVNLILLSPEIDYNGLLKSGHLLNHALQFADLINDYAIYEKKKSFYADKINITKKTLDESLNYIYRKSFKELLANWIIIESMKLLVFGDKSISLIAHELGYDTSNFIKFFSRQKGIHPKALRESYREMIKEIENVY
jgi:AraC-like DNA-binding protein